MMASPAAACSRRALCDAPAELPPAPPRPPLTVTVLRSCCRQPLPLCGGWLRLHHRSDVASAWAHEIFSHAYGGAPCIFCDFWLGLFSSLLFFAIEENIPMRQRYFCTTADQMAKRGDTERGQRQAESCKQATTKRRVLDCRTRPHTQCTSLTKLLCSGLRQGHHGGHAQIVHRLRTSLGVGG